MSVRPLDLQVNIQSIPIIAKHQAEKILKASEDQRLTDEKNIQDVKKDLDKASETEEAKTAENNMEHEDFYNASKKKSKHHKEEQDSNDDVINETKEEKKNNLDDDKDHINILA